MSLPYRRLLLKLSGESLMGSDKFGINQEACIGIATAIKEIRSEGLEVSVVIGGGNIFRGIHLEQLGIERTSADQMGMLATLINGKALQQSLVHIGCKSKVMSALNCPQVAAPYNWENAIEELSQGTTLIFAGGTGNPYFTTDTAAALRASEIKADILLKATKVNGVYSKDPVKHPDATFYSTLTYSQVLAEKLEVMDATAIALCRSNDIPVFVFNMQKLYDHQIINALSQQEEYGTLIKGD